MKISRVQQDPRVSDQDVKSPARSKRSRCQESGKSQESGVSDQDTRSPVLDWNAARGFVLKFRENYREKYLEIFSSLWFQTGRRGPGCGAERIHCTWLSQGISVELNYPHRYSEREKIIIILLSGENCKCLLHCNIPLPRNSQEIFSPPNTGNHIYLCNIINVYIFLFLIGTFLCFFCYWICLIFSFYRSTIYSV